MKQVLIKKGRVLCEEVAEPQVTRGAIKVAVEASAISPGTEMAGLVASGRSLMQRALAQPQKVTRAVERAAKEGMVSVLRKARQNVEAENATGYSAAGTVVAVGDGVSEFHVGERVACAGSLYAYHAEVISVPKNLAVRVPREVCTTDAATVALGAIALQGVRRGDVRIGERVVVIGCGAVGLLTIQLLRASGCRVIGVDLDATRLEKAGRFGADAVIDAGAEDVVEKVVRLCDGRGPDVVIVATATSSSEPVLHAFKMVRRRGRVVLVGVAGDSYSRDEMYAKELDFVISRSYGPGRSDGAYEERGRDYPYAYVRWTERRNMAAYLDLIACGKVNPKALIEATFPVSQAQAAFESLSGSSGPVLAVLTYPNVEKSPAPSRPPSEGSPLRGSVLPGARSRTLGLALIGAGGFVQSMHAPNLLRLHREYSVRWVVDASIVTARKVAGMFSGCHSATDVRAALDAGDVDAVLVATRHNTHADLSLQALEAGKAVFVEKPMCLTDVEFDRLEKAWTQTTAPFMVGYNRRFSPFAVALRERICHAADPITLCYRVNAGFVPYDHWIQTEEGGGRIMGEACHMVDLLRYLVGAPAVRLSVSSIRPRTRAIRSSDNWMADIEFEDGSIASLIYTASGSSAAPKERLEAFFDGHVVVIDDFSSMSVFGKTSRRRRLRRPDKGHLEELRVFHDSVLEQKHDPIPYAELTEVWQVTKSIRDQVLE